MIEANKVSKHYLINGQQIPVVKEVDFFIGKGEMVSIVGRSGSGKSTLMNLLGCLDKATSGSLIIAGNDVSKMDSNEMASLRGRKIGFVFQSFNLITRNNVLKNVEVPMIYQGMTKKDRVQQAEKILLKVNMLDRKIHYPNQLSGGQQQRVAIARSLVNEPDLILADEPTGALDSKNGKEIMDIFRSLTDEGRTVVIVTHDPEVANASDRILTMSDGVLTE